MQIATLALIVSLGALFFVGVLALILGIACSQISRAL
jgi:hypothetical protein